MPAVAEVKPSFKPTSCGNLPDIGDVLSRLRCGVVRVPRDHAHPDGPTFALAVVIIATEVQPALPDPVVYISGGPGAPLTIYAGFQARQPYAAGHDLILVDQRGTGRSQPRLCPDLQSSLVTAMLAVVAEPTPAALAADRAVHAACHDELLGSDIDPDSFGTATTIEDYESVRRALGVARWNVVGESYGTTVAMTLLARHPDSIRSAVLDSLNPPDVFFGMPWSMRVAQARKAFLAACHAESDCGASYRQAVARLEHEAPFVKLPPDLRVPGDRVRLTPSLFEEVVGRLVYYPPTHAGLPHLITATRDGDLRPVGSALVALLEGAERNGHEGAFVAVECRDRSRWRESAAPDASPLDLGLLPPGVCADWSALGPEPEVPHDTAVPTLVLAGQFDPNITPEQSHRVADRIGPKARWILFAGIGHSVRHFSTCAQTLVAAFIAQPRSARGRGMRRSGSGFRSGTAMTTAEPTPSGPLITAVVHGTDVRADVGTPVPWWSFGKTVMASAALALVAEGRLRLDEPVRGKPFTLRQLLGHRAGLRCYGGLRAYHEAVAEGEHPWDEREMLRRVDAGTLAYEPGQGWGYSKVGYFMVRELVETAADLPLGSALDRLAFAPLDIQGVAVVAEPAHLDATAWGNARRYHPGWVYHGLLVGPPGAAALFLHRLLAGHLLPPDLLAAMLDAYPVGGAVAGRPWTNAGYGLGLMIGQGEPPGEYVGHTGGGPGSTSAVYQFAGAPPGARRTAASFAPVDDPAVVEARALAVAASG